VKSPRSDERHDAGGPPAESDRRIPSHELLQCTGLSDNPSNRASNSHKRSPEVNGESYLQRYALRNCRDRSRALYAELRGRVKIFCLQTTRLATVPCVCGEIIRRACEAMEPKLPMVGLVHRRRRRDRFRTLGAFDYRLPGCRRRHESLCVSYFEEWADRLRRRCEWLSATR